MVILNNNNSNCKINLFYKKHLIQKMQMDKVSMNNNKENLKFRMECLIQLIRCSYYNKKLLLHIMDQQWTFRINQ